MIRTRVRFTWHDRVAPAEFRTGVSLHSHTMYSRENCGFIPEITAKIPILNWEMCRQARKYRERTGNDPDYTRAYWTPPLPPQEAYDLESRQIQQRFGLAALVSLSDHDNVEAAAELARHGGNAPASLEWTVPIGTSYFHLGLHNIPPGEVPHYMPELARYTAQPEEPLRVELLQSLARHPDVLVVLNHPLWDQARLGVTRHRALLRQFLESSSGCIHALELNGLRRWTENQAIIDLARAWGYTLISGGDRHGCEPSAVLNLTKASTFSEFVSEIRSGYSEVAFLNHYRQPSLFRIIKSICDIMGDYPNLPGRVHWYDRVFCKLGSGAIVPMCQAWQGEAPGVVRCFEHFTRLVRRACLMPSLNRMIEAF